VAVLGFDPGVQPHALKDRIGVCLQATNLPEKIKVGEAVRLFGSFYSRSVSGDALLDRLQLSENATRITPASPVGRNSVWRSLSPWSTTLRCCFSMSRPPV